MKPFRKIKDIKEDGRLFAVYFEGQDTPLYCNVAEKEAYQLEDAFVRGNITLEDIREYGDLHFELGVTFATQ